MTILARLSQYASLLGREFDETTANNISISGLGTFFASEFIENVGITTTLTTRTFLTYDPVSDDFIGDPLSDALGGAKGTYMRYNTDKSVIVYEDIDEVTDYRNIATEGLVLDLNAASSLSYNGSGITWTDLSGSGNNGTLVNGVSYNSGNGGSLNFNYLDSEYVSFSNASSLQFLNRSPYTLSAWVYPTRNPGLNNFTGIFDREDSSIGSRDGFNLLFLGGSGTDTYFYTERFVAGAQVSAGGVLLNQSVTVNNWQYIVATYDGTNLILYRNGAIYGTSLTSTGNITNTAKILTIGVRGGQYFGGNISQAQIYNRALTAAEITQNYNALKSFYGL